MGGWVSPTDGIDALKNRKTSVPTAIRTPGRPGCGKSLYRLRYLESFRYGVPKTRHIRIAHQHEEIKTVCVPVVTSNLPSTGHRTSPGKQVYFFISTLYVKLRRDSSQQ